ncbi:MAG: DM13 domain-containing protein [Rhodothermales bacterium]|jgi:predicted RNA-binding protein (virulence factor B family)
MRFLTSKIAAVVILSALLAIPANAANGTFIGTEGERVSGDAVVSAKEVKLSNNFKTTSGPDLYVYLGNDKPTKIIGKLKKNSGSQTYALPDGVDLSKYSAVFIHCKKYNHTFGRADLR